jgi:chromate transporter
MNDDVLKLFWAFTSTAFFAIGGASALIPEFHRQIVEVYGLMNDAQFASAVALAQLAPGPNMLMVSFIGWQVAGLPGLLVSTFAIVGPPSLLAFAVGRAMEKVKDSPVLKAIKVSLAPIVVGMMVASGLITARAAGHDYVGYALTGASAAFMLTFRRNPLWIICAGAIVGLAANRLGLMTL